jgi:transcriptional regulator with XRE-family HTH domain
MKTKSEFAERLKQAMLAAGYEPRPGVLEKEFNMRHWGRPVSFQSASSWLKGACIPTQDKLQVLAEWLKVEPQILRFGEQSARSIREQKRRWDEAVSGPEREVLETFAGLPMAQKKVAREVILALAVKAEVESQTAGPGRSRKTRSNAANATSRS